MKEFEIEIIEQLSKTIIIKAYNKEEALTVIKKLYNKECIVLYPEECDIEIQYIIKEISFSN